MYSEFSEKFTCAIVLTTEQFCDEKLALNRRKISEMSSKSSAT